MTLNEFRIDHVKSFAGMHLKAIRFMVELSTMLSILFSDRRWEAETVTDLMLNSPVTNISLLDASNII